MKKAILFMAATSMAISACNKKAEDHGHDHTDGTHQHADGEEHTDHTDSDTKQEEFTVSVDSSATKDAEGHEHEMGAEHQH